MTAKLNWPPWWEWELVFTDHTEARMDERLCTELDARRMMELTSNFNRGNREGRWEVETRFRGNPWKVIVEPDPAKKRLVVVTVYPVEPKEMRDVYLEVTYRRGSPWVAYLHLSRNPGDESDRCVEVEPDMVLEINAEGKLMGIELTTPELVTLEVVNEVLEEYGFEPLDASDLKPLLAA